MRINRILTLICAAAAGTWVYHAMHDRKEPEDLSSKDRSTYSTLSGHGSLVETFHAAREANQNDGLLTLRTQSSGGIGRVGQNGAGFGISNTAAPQPLGGGTPIQGAGASSGSYSKASNNSIELITAAAKDDKETVSKLLAQRAKVDSRDSLHRTALMYACAGGYMDVIERLVAAGASATLEDDAGNNAYDFAAGRGLVDTVRYLLRATHGRDEKHYLEYASIMQATLAGDPALLPEGKGQLATVNRVNTEGQAPLHIAAGSGLDQLAAELLRRGANPNVRNSGHQTPLHWAVWNNQVKTASLLLEKGANINQQDLAGNTPLLLAVQNHSTQAAELLIQKGADRDIANKDSKTPAILADDKGFTDLLAMLRR